MATKHRRLTKQQAGIKHGWRSGLEEDIAKQIKANKHTVRYEQRTINWVQPAQNRKYTPDFELDNGILIETKGRWVTADRMKHRMIKAQFPELDIRFVFQNAKAKISKGSKTTYADYCNKYGFKWAHKTIPGEWYDER